MSPAAGGAAPAQSAAAAAAVVAPAIAEQEPDRAPARRDPPGPVEGFDPANAAARKIAWIVRAPTPAAAANPGGGIIGGDASWPALVESKRGKSASSDSLKSLSDGSGPSVQEDSIAASVPPHPAAEGKLISTGSNPAATLPPNAASSQQNGTTTQPNLGRRSGSNDGNNGGSRGNVSGGSGRVADSSGGSASNGSGGDGNHNGENIDSGSSCNSSNGDGGSNLSYNNVPGSGTSGNGNDSSRNTLGNNKWNNSIRGSGSRSSNGNADGNNRNSGGSSNQWNNNYRNSNGTSGGGGRGGYRGRRDHERGGNFSPRNYPRGSVMPYQQQQQPGVFQPSPFPRPPPPPAAHYIVPQQFMPYVPPFAYHGDMQSYPLYLPPVEQFQNMHLFRPPMQPSWVPQDQQNLQEGIRMQIEFYFSTNNLCHDTFLRRHMNDQGWVPIDLILGFNRMRAFTGLVDTNYILDAIRSSESLEVQGNNVRRRNDWAEWLLH